MQARTPVITAKLLVPTRRPELLRRSRLVDFLHAHLHRKLIVVAAPAGYGKTSLLVDFAHEVDAPVCWYALDRYDADPRVFLDHLIASIQRYFPEFGQRTLRALENTPDLQKNLYPIAGIMANELFEIPEYIVIVLDDFHALGDSAIISEFLGLLLQYVGENVHFIISSRTVPAIPNTALMVARQEMVGVGMEMLRFTPEEIQALVKQNYDLDLPRERAEDLARHSDGWITGILLMAQRAGWQDLLAGVVDLSNVTGHVYEYLAEQVFNQQPALLQDFLLGTSVLEELTPERCDRLLGIRDSARLLHQLAQQNLFITLLDRDTYAYHHLFREFLYGRLRRVHPQRFSQLALKAAELYIEQGEWERAVAVYLDLGMYEEAAQAIERLERDLFAAGRWETLVQWINRLPKPVLDKHPILLALRGRIEAERGNVEEALSVYEQALHLFAESNNFAQVVRTLIRKSQVYLYTGRYSDALASIEQAHSLVPSLQGENREKIGLYGGVLQHKGVSLYRLGRVTEAAKVLEESASMFTQAQDTLGLAYTAYWLGCVYWSLGKLQQAIEQYKLSLRYWEPLHNVTGMVQALSGLGVVHRTRGEWQLSERYCMEAIQLAEAHGLQRDKMISLVALGDFLKVRRRYDRALQTYDKAAFLADAIEDKYFATYVLQNQAYIYAKLNEWEKSERCANGALGEATRLQQPYLMGLSFFSQGILAIERGDIRLAEEVLLQAQQVLERAGAYVDLARVHLYQAYITWLVGDEPRALQILGEMLGFVEGSGAYGVIVAEGHEMTLLLQRAISSGVGRQILFPILQRLQEEKTRITPKPSSMVSLPIEKFEVRIYGFGHGRIIRDGKEIPTQRRTVKELFFFLLSRHPQPVRKDEIVETFWPDLSPSRAASTLRVTLYRLRHTICDVVTQEGWVYLKLPESIWFDVWAFDEAVKLALRASKKEEEITWYQRAIDLYVGAYLEDVDAEWAQIERQRLYNSYLTALLNLATRRLEEGEYGQALNLFSHITNLEPFQEEAWQGLMKAHVKLGNRAAAIEAYHKMRSLLQEHLGLDPAPTSEYLYRNILDMRV